MRSLQGGNHFLQSFDGVLLDSLGNLPDIGPRQPSGDLLHVLAHLGHGLGEGDRRAFLVQQGQRLVGLLSDRSLLAAQLASFDFGIVVAIVLRHIIQANRPFIDLDLQLQHLAEAALKLREHAFDFLFAKLSQDFLECSLGLLQLLDGPLLLFDGPTALSLFQFAHSPLAFAPRLGERALRAGFSSGLAC